MIIIISMLLVVLVRMQMLILVRMRVRVPLVLLVKYHPSSGRHAYVVAGRRRAGSLG